MGFLDKMRGHATRAADQHGDKIARGLDQAGAAADKKTKGKYSRQIGTGTSRAKDALEKNKRKDGGAP